ncbi:MAG: hypothetical protein GX366_05120 [Epulopiscium sp.]|nr:hypothetical protein [Candidatus Epulonipiscium sp.]
MTIIVTIKTKNIEKVLDHMTTAEKYNENKFVYREKFKGHKLSVDQSGLSRALVTDLLILVYSFLAEYKSLLSYAEFLKIKYIIIPYLERDYSKIDSHKTNQYLAYIIGRLSKEEKTK